MTKRYYNAAFKKGGTCLSGQRFRQQVLGEKSTKDMEEMPTNFTTGFFLKENEILSEYSPVSRSDFR